MFTLIGVRQIEGRSEGLAFEIMQAEMRELRKMMEISLMDRNKASRRGSISAIEYERISNLIEKVSGNKRIPMEEKMHQYHLLMREAEELMMRCDEKSDHMHFRHLVERIHQAMSENA